VGPAKDAGAFFQSSREAVRYMPATMATKCSFDVTTGVDLQEVDNAINQANKEVVQRYDFKGAKVDMILDRKSETIRLEVDNDMRMRALVEVLKTKLAKRNVALKNIQFGDDQVVGLSRIRKDVTLTQGIASDVARKIVKAVKDQKMKKVQIAIVEDSLRVTGTSKDDLQEVIAFLKSEDFEIELQFGNYR
jgi:cyclic-di-GMP-binding protein